MGARSWLRQGAVPPQGGLGYGGEAPRPWATPQEEAARCQSLSGRMEALSACRSPRDGVGRRVAAAPHVAVPAAPAWTVATVAPVPQKEADRPRRPILRRPQDEQLAERQLGPCL